MKKDQVMSFDELQKKVAEAKAGGIDLSTEEDLSIAVMNLLSLEEHFFFTGAKTSKPEYYDFLHETREIRKKLLGRMIKKTEGESWCISKHLLATTMRLMEVGTKLHSEGKKDLAKETFEFAYKIYNLFFALRLKILDAPAILEHVQKERPMSIDDIMKTSLTAAKNNMKTAPLIASAIIIVAIIASMLVYTRKNSSENPSSDALISFAQCLAEKKMTMYGAEWCPHCKREKALFGKEAFSYVPYVECPENTKLCLDKGIDGYPTWIDGEGKKYPGEQGLEGLSQISGCAYLDSNQGPSRYKLDALTN